ncbi:MAG TPA: DEAD/DEAH box helicase family protein [Tepidisphaeraceae bacterium]|nr:DEAD/DEAH box helicase family protein [Tepidisphaeraceae bacterium]
MIAVVEAKAAGVPAADGMQQAKDYAEILGLSFAYATNGTTILEFDYLTGVEREIEQFPSPLELWQRLQAARGLSTTAAAQLLTPANHQTEKGHRYYQEIAINRAVEAMVSGRKRALLTMATGTGKTATAFQICWKLWIARWNRSGEHRKPRILYLADRNILVDDPKDKMFAPFGDARHKIESEAIQSREMYFAIYQAIAKDERRPGLYREYPPDFFDLIIIDECHRGSANEQGSWREILEYFAPAYQLGMTATPKRQDNVDTYKYFGDAIYTYSLRQGIDDGFLAPYRVHRIVTSWDAAGWRPSAGDVDRFGAAIPDDEYGTKDFERVVALRKRTEAIARHLSDFLKRTDRFAKTIVFCVDQEHASEMRAALIRFNSDLVRRHPDYVCRVTSDEKEIGIGHLSHFQDVERQTPVILTTSQLLTTGVDAPTCKNIVLARVIGSMTEFKQIIGRGTRVRDDYGKLWFSILDYTGTATRMFADEEFDGDPVSQGTTTIADDGAVVDEEEGDDTGGDEGDDDLIIDDWERDDETGPPVKRKKYYFDGGRVEIVAHLVHELDVDGKQLRVVEFRDYTREKVRTLYPSADALRSKWSDPQQRAEIAAALGERGIDLEELAATSGEPDADPFDLLCHVAYNAPLLTRRQRAEKLKRDRADFFDRFGPDARRVLANLLEKYAEHGAAELTIPEALKVAPIADFGTVPEIAAMFGGVEPLRAAVAELQANLYAA